MARFVLYIVIMFSVVLSSCESSNQKDKLISTDVVSQTSSIEFSKTTHDFGKLIVGEKVKFGFKFKNTGDADLLITAVKTSCGCTVSEYPKQPVKPGDEGVIMVSFDSHGRKGFQNKTATVIANTQPTKTTLRIKAMVYDTDNI